MFENVVKYIEDNFKESSALNTRKMETRVLKIIVRAKRKDIN